MRDVNLAAIPDRPILTEQILRGLGLAGLFAGGTGIRISSHGRQIARTGLECDSIITYWVSETYCVK